MASTVSGTAEATRAGDRPWRRALDARTRTWIVASLVALAFPALAHAATRYVADSGVDGPGCGLDAKTACRSITQAIQLAAPGDTVTVGPGRYGDLNRSGVLGDAPGEETGAPGCGCAVAINKPVIVVSRQGAAVTLIDARTVYLVQNVLLITNGGEFGRPGKGFTVTETRHVGYKANDGHGIVIDSINVMVRGNRVIYTANESNVSIGIYPVNNEWARIEGNHVSNWNTGIVARGAARVSRNEVVGNNVGIAASSGEVVGNVATQNGTGIRLSGTATAKGNAAYANPGSGIVVAGPFTGQVTGNNLFGNDGAGENCGLTNQSVAGLNAANNYWGAPAGPGAPPADRDCVAVGYTGWTTTSPFASKPFSVVIVKP